MSEEKATVKTIREVFSLDLSIPDYQRPYKWTDKNVQQLIDDLLVHFRANKVYRIGTIVLYKSSDKNEFDIVDGQQRLITLALLLYKLDYENIKFLENSKLNHTISRSNILDNYKFIDNYNFLDVNEFKEYILDICQMVSVVLADLDEAFQFFDSQNARGKPLESYDLLKAYHLREMQNKNEQIIYKCVERWENASVSSDINNLDKIINYILFRIRRWHYEESGEVFTSDQLDTFKGISEYAEFPYLNGILSSRAMQKMASDNPLIYHPRFTNPSFQSTQVLVNGEYFFNYIHYYTQLYGYLFKEGSGVLEKIGQINNQDLGKGLVSFLNSYKSHNRVGDQYLRNLFECVVLFYFDKFGNKFLDEFVTKAFIWVYQIRLEYQRISFHTVENKVNSKSNLFTHIERSITPEQVLRFRTVSIIKNFNNVDSKIMRIMENFYVEQ